MYHWYNDEITLSSDDIMTFAYLCRPEVFTSTGSSKMVATSRA